MEGKSFISVQFRIAIASRGLGPYPLPAASNRIKLNIA
jgi:hypothetical protein